jgi:hypothetical protein
MKWAFARINKKFDLRRVFWLPFMPMYVPEEMAVPGSNLSVLFRGPENARFLEQNEVADEPILH